MLERFGSKCAIRTDDELVVLESNTRGVFEEGLEIRFRDLDLQESKGCGPQLLRVERRQREPPEMGAKKGESLPTDIFRQVKFIPPV